jgi:hypothetical protein
MKPISAKVSAASANQASSKKQSSILGSHLFDKLQPHIFNLISVSACTEAKMAKHNSNVRSSFSFDLIGSAQIIPLEGMGGSFDPKLIYQTLGNSLGTYVLEDLWMVQENRMPMLPCILKDLSGAFKNYCSFELKKICLSQMLLFTPLIAGLVDMCKLFPLSKDKRLIPKNERDTDLKIQ